MTCVYDSNGNTHTKVVGSNTTAYAWDYENRLSKVTTDELLRSNGAKPSRRVLRRMERIQDLQPRRQYFVLQALDALLSSSVK